MVQNPWPAVSKSILRTISSKICSIQVVIATHKDQEFHDKVLDVHHQRDMIYVVRCPTIHATSPFGGTINIEVNKNEVAQAYFLDPILHKISE